MISSSLNSTSSVRFATSSTIDVALAERGNRSAARRLGRDVPDRQPARRAREAAVGEQQHRLAEPGAGDGRR